MNGTKILHLFYKAAIRLHRSRLARCLYWVVNPLWNGISRRLPSCEEARRVLDGFHKDRGTGSLTEAVRSVAAPRHDLTIIVAAYNVGEYIEECLDSLLSQDTRYDFEVRVVNDASTDDTAAKLAGYDDPRLRVITHERNQGLSAARNTALKDLDTKYVCIVDSDDKLEPGAIENALNRAYEAGADIVETGLRRFTDDGAIPYTLIPEDSMDTPLEAIIGFPTIFLYDARLYDHIQFPQGYWYEDVIFESLLFLRARRVASTSAPYHMYRLRECSITTSAENPKQMDSLYGGKTAICDSVKLGLWSTDRNCEYLTDYLCHIVRITYSRTHRFGQAVRLSVFVSWMEFFSDHKDDLRLLPPTLKDARLIEAIKTGNYRRYELLCIMDYTGL